MPCIVFYVSGHGFGHAARDIEVLNALGRARPDLRIVVRTAAPRWLFDLTLGQPVDFHDVECDTGVVQIDSLRLDEGETIRRAAEFYGSLGEKAAREADFLCKSGAELVVGDIPPLAFAAAEAADLPSIAIGNFTWDWIYGAYRDRLAEAPDLLTPIRRAYRSASLALRLPMFGGFEAFGPIVRDIPFIARHSMRSRAEICRALSLPEARPLVLMSFGGYGLEGIDLMKLAQVEPYTIVTTGNPGRGGGTAETMPQLPPNVIWIDEWELYGCGYRYEDLVAAADVVVTKPGYGIIAESIANGTAILYTPRGRFAEYDVLVAAMPRYTRSRFIGHDDLFAGTWSDHLDRLLAQEPPPQRVPTNGAEVAAKIIADHLG